MQFGSYCHITQDTICHSWLSLKFTLNSNMCPYGGGVQWEVTSSYHIVMAPSDSATYTSLQWLPLPCINRKWPKGVWQLHMLPGKLVHSQCPWIWLIWVLFSFGLRFLWNCKCKNLMRNKYLIWPFIRLYCGEIQTFLVFPPSTRLKMGDIKMGCICIYVCP